MPLNQAILDRTGSFHGLYDPAFEHDACGVGFVASIKGQRSNSILRKALTCVCSLIHRGAMDADAKTGDGAGVLTQIPHRLFRYEVEKMGHKLFQDSDLGVGMMFLPNDPYTQARCRHITEEVVREHKLVIFGWRVVPVNQSVLGEKALRTCPDIEQIFIGRPDQALMDDDEFERKLFICRNQIEDMAESQGIKDFYIPSFSSRTIVYKGLLAAPTLERFYLDLRDPNYQTALAVFHQRYSTNTFPTWPLAQSLRMLSHNGEINTIQGNRLWTRAREPELKSPLFGDAVKKLRPIIQPGGSDSASLDNALELLVMGGRDILHSMLMLVPAAWQGDPSVPAEIKEFYEYHQTLNEPWDGPAALVFSDGRTVGACLDRNGLRPSRYKVTDDGLFCLGSEVGLLPIDDAKVVEKGRLAPGEVIAVDTIKGKLLRNCEIKTAYAKRQPYGAWLRENIKDIESRPSLEAQMAPGATLLQQQVAAGYNEEETTVTPSLLKTMAETGEEAIGSMGDDTPLAVLSKRPRLLYTYFKQLFAQVTNPPIDPIREKLVMSVEVLAGRRRNWLDETPEHARVLRLQSPVLTNPEMRQILALEDGAYKTRTISSVFPVSEGPDGLKKNLDRICQEAEAAIEDGASILILSDWDTSAEKAAIPMLLATGAVHHHLIRADKRSKASLICETSECREVHQLACLLGYGASAVNPYTALATLNELFSRGELKVADAATAAKNYRYALEKGLLKIMSKMGISALASYSGAQTFQAIGLQPEVIACAFNGTPSQVNGLSFREIAGETLARHARAFSPEAKILDEGVYRYRRDGELHAYTPAVIQSFHTYVGIKGADKAGKWEDYGKYVAAVEEAAPVALRQCLALKKGNPIPIEEVEPIEDIRRRFTTAGMSLGALSPEAHETLAIAMNRIGGKSNSGEGGEDRARFTPLENGDSKNSRIKQVASGRFGVTAEYLASATEIEIKMAQGSKPGEGGQIPGHKVSAMIAKLRRSTPGVMLISPPPHHDIYSIEDLAQLIYDLKQVNPRAKVCVKLVAEAGVGTIAAGVAKAYADIVLISGHDGGTGASPLSSVKNAGAPWELGLSEAHQVLLLNGLRNRVTLRTDGGMKTGLDILIAAMLGAEEFNFGTAALIATGCVYVRKCHLNTCPVGVTSQDEKFRAKYKGTPENVVLFFNAVAEEVRRYLAGIGARTLNDVIGRTDYLEQRQVPDHPKANMLDLSRLLAMPKVDTGARFHTWERNDKLEDRTLDDVILQDAKSCLQTKHKQSLKYKVKNTYRSIGTQLSGEIAYRYGDEGLPDGTLTLDFSGSAGQSLGAFLVRGVRINLVGESNDYVGKGMSGGEIILVPSPVAKFDPAQNSICGNTVLYGATGGSLFARGCAGERFAVRNSGATAVVEGIGDHGCEYMTNGRVVVLGATGKNFGAGMSGGIAYVLDREGVFEQRCNRAMVTLQRLADADEINALKGLIFKHLELTESARAKEILGDWARFEPLFWKVAPHPPVSATPPAASAAAGGNGSGSPAVNGTGGSVAAAAPASGEPAKA
ncbi:MAG TPA: glutamate synthase large subunit [Candidatus Methylacidiphilales bacterium]|nr:glutamate synthase large subunit [Candidatus Methylacidiphilales bacterium]